MTKIVYANNVVDLKPSRLEAEEAVRTLIKWIGDNPEREELANTPQRVINSFAEIFSGYKINPEEENFTVFDNKYDYDDIVTVKDIDFNSYCEHHFVPISGKITVSYIPNKKIIGLSKIPRIVDIYAKRLQIQERLVIEIAQSINKLLSPKGVAVVIKSSHNCMTTRGVNKPGSLMQTSYMLGSFKDPELRKEFLNHAFEKNSKQY